jgi:HEAT repeats
VTPLNQLLLDQRPRPSDIDEMLQPLLDALTDPDDDRRRGHVRHLLAAAQPPALGVVVDRLVELLAAPKASVRRQAAATLTEIGPPALPALRSALVARGRPRVQRVAGEILAAVAPRLRPDQRTGLSFDAMIVGLQTHDAAVQGAASRLIAAVRKEDEPGTGCSPDAARLLFERFGGGGDVRGMLTERPRAEALPEGGGTPPAPFGDMGEEA